jgi:hypothetical protein
LDLPKYLIDYFDDLLRNGVVLTDAQKRWYSKKYELLGESIKSEFPSSIAESFEVNTSGLYYAAHISAARSQGRIRNIPYDRTNRVHTAWDLGISDATSIIFFQIIGREIHIVDYIEGSGKSLADYIKLVKNKEYIYGTHIAPHDIRNREYSTGLSRLDTAAKLGHVFTLSKDLSLMDGIDCVRNTLPRMYFHNGDDTLRLVRHLENYSQAWDRSLGMWSGRPIHDAASHAADCIRYLALSIDLCIDEVQSVSQSEADNLWRTFGRKM